MKQEALDTALALAPQSRTLTSLARNVNEELGLDWSDGKWRGIWKDNPSEKFLIQKKLGSSFSEHVHGQKCHVGGNVRFAVVNDAHSPYHDKRAVALAAQVLAWWKPDILVHNGDNIDARGLSKFDQNPNRKFRLQDEVDLWQAEVALPLNRAAGPGCRKIVLPGNHDLRVLRTLWQNPDLYSLRNLSLPCLLGVDELGMEYSGYAVVVGEAVEISHGTKTTAKAELTKRGYSICTLTGHVHRAGSFLFTRPYGGPVWAQEVPCLCHTQVEYGIDMNWLQGLAIGAVDDGIPWREVVVFNPDYSCRVGDQRFSL